MNGPTTREPKKTRKNSSYYYPFFFEGLHRQRRLKYATVHHGRPSVSRNINKRFAYKTRPEPKFILFFLKNIIRFGPFRAIVWIGGWVGGGGVRRARANHRRCRGAPAICLLMEREKKLRRHQRRSYLKRKSICRRLGSISLPRPLDRI